MRIVVAEAAKAFGSWLIKQKIETLGAFRYKVAAIVRQPLRNSGLHQ